MAYRNLRDCLRDLENHRHLVRINVEVDPRLEAAAIHRRVFQSAGPAIFFTNVKGCHFPMVSNLFGSLERAKFLFRHQWKTLEVLMNCQARPERAFHPSSWWHLLRGGWNSLPRMVRHGPLLNATTTLSQLPQLVCWPNDGGPFITLPQVYSEDVEDPGWRNSNLGMYRVQLSGNQYQPDTEAGLHYQIHRGIGIHHAKAIEKGFPFRLAISVGGPPSLALAAVMPLPEGLPEIAFAGALGGRRVEMVPCPGLPDGSLPLPLPAQADFCIVGTVDPQRLLPEGPFGDHLGYYSLRHDFPVLKVEKIFHRKNAVWPFTVVGRPPQEDTAFGALIHELTRPLIPRVVPGIHAVHAVDAAGVHPLLLAIGSERYTPYQKRKKPQELLTGASALLGQGQLSLAKFLFIVAKEDDPTLDIHDIPRFLNHLLQRIDLENDLHFHTRTTMDTLDYSGGELNQGSKLILAAVGEPRRELPKEISPELRLPQGFAHPRVFLPGILAVQAPTHPGFAENGNPQSAAWFCSQFQPGDWINRFPWVVLVDHSAQATSSLRDFLWTVFTKTDPAKDLDGICAFITNKHWGCRGSLVIDARVKAHHAPALEVDPGIEKRVDALGARGGPLHGII